MNKSIKYLRFAALTVSVLSISVYAQGTNYLSRRPINVNLPTIVYGGNTTNYHKLPPINNQNIFTLKVAGNNVNNNNSNNNNIAAKSAYDKKANEANKINKTNAALANSVNNYNNIGTSVDELAFLYGDDSDHLQSYKEMLLKGLAEINTKEDVRIKLQEDAQLKQMQNAPRLQFRKSKDLKPLIKKCNDQARNAYELGNNDVGARLTARINAFDQTFKQKSDCSDYSNQVKHP